MLSNLIFRLLNNSWIIQSKPGNNNKNKFKVKKLSKEGKISIKLRRRIKIKIPLINIENKLYKFQLIVKL